VKVSAQCNTLIMTKSGPVQRTVLDNSFLNVYIIGLRFVWALLNNRLSFLMETSLPAFLK